MQINIFRFVAEQNVRIYMPRFVDISEIYLFTVKSRYTLPL